ncbi:MAG: MerR family transcriptional regulator [Planctomycetaceae bacterium]|nr:MerR family transcriptional regulator [Planctomycetaceae bacterium]
MPKPDPTPFAPDRLLKIGDFARLAGTNLRTLRYYEELGLLIPASRSDGGFRYYRPTDLNRLEMIKNLQDLGLPLERIGELMATRDAGLGRSSLLSRVAEALSEQDRLIEERIQLLEGQRAKLSAAARKLSQCADCPHTPGTVNNFCEPCVNTGEVLPEHLSALF